MAELKLFKCLDVPRGNYKDIFDYQAIQMVIIHNIVIRAYNSMLYYSGEVEPGTAKYKSFLAYCAYGTAFLHWHHESEEELWFPFLEEKFGEGTMAENAAGHHAFETGVANFENFIKKLQADEVEWDLTKFREAIYEFVPVLIDHLKFEPSTFRADRLKKHMTEQDLKDFQKKLEAHIFAHTSIIDDCIFAMINGDSVHGAWFPPAPGPMLTVIRYTFYFRRSDMWQFGACDKWLKVKPPFAAYEPQLEPEGAAVSAVP